MYICTNPIAYFFIIAKNALFMDDDLAVLAKNDYLQDETQ